MRYPTWIGAVTSTNTNISLGNLRAMVIIIVVAFHSALPYLASQPLHPFPFDAAPYRWISFPIVDEERWFGFDLFCAWQDVSLMSLMFFLAGLLTPASLNRKGSLVYFKDRWWRIAVPFLFAVTILSPLAYGIHLVHYCFVLWLQYMLLHFDLNAIGKTTIVFTCALVLSWAVNAAVSVVGARQAWSTTRQAIVHWPR